MKELLRWRALRQVGAEGSCGRCEWPCSILMQPVGASESILCGTSQFGSNWSVGEGAEIAPGAHVTQLQTLPVGEKRKHALYISLMAGQTGEASRFRSSTQHFRPALNSSAARSTMGSHSSSASRPASGAQVVELVGTQTLRCPTDVSSRAFPLLAGGAYPYRKEQCRYELDLAFI